MASDSTSVPTSDNPESSHSPRSPKITHIAWGQMEVDGIGAGKDFKLYPGGGHAWDWAEHGTRHEPGIHPGELQELLDHGATVIVLSRGMQNKLKTMPETMKVLEERDVQVYVEETKAAVEIYNRLADTALVGGLFHSTC